MTTLARRTDDGACKITVAKKTQLSEALDTEEDWTGISSAQERRKLQNRLHQRAWRRRKAQTQPISSSTLTKPPQHTTRGNDALSAAFEDATKAFFGALGLNVQGPQPAILPASTISTTPPASANQLPFTPPSPSSNSATKLIAPILPTTKLSGSTHLPFRPNHTEPKFIPIFPLSPDHHLITLIQYNVFRALMVNFILTNTFDTLINECGVDLNLPLMHSVPDTVPPNFKPTELQMTVRHNRWIDSVPCPRLRDNLIRACAAEGSIPYHQSLNTNTTSSSSSPPTTEHTLDEDALCTDICGGIYDGLDDCATRGLLVWGDPWVVGNWEVSQGFVEKWGWLLEGCVEMLEATDRWRAGRGEEKMGVVVGEVHE